MKAMEREGASRRSVTYKGHFQWPSKSSVLTTPERKRSRRSTSFADSGLGSSIFGSPPSKSVSCENFYHFQVNMEFHILFGIQKQVQNSCFVSPETDVCMW